MDYIKKYEEEANAKIKELQEIKKTIKPCPFCGKPVELLNLCYGNGNYGSGSHFVICCSNCKLDMEGPDTSWTHFYDHNNEVRKFVEKWNTRCEGELAEEGKMTDEELKKKICEIIAPHVSAWGEDERIADALIAAEIGDVRKFKEVEHRAKVLGRTLVIMKRKGLISGVVDDYIMQAEKELAEERKDE